MNDRGLRTQPPRIVKFVKFFSRFIVDTFGDVGDIRTLWNRPFVIVIRLIITSTGERKNTFSKGIITIPETMRVVTTVNISGMSMQVRYSALCTADVPDKISLSSLYLPITESRLGGRAG